MPKWKEGDAFLIPSGKRSPREMFGYLGPLSFRSFGIITTDHDGSIKANNYNGDAPYLAPDHYLKLLVKK